MDTYLKWLIIIAVIVVVGGLAMWYMGWFG